MALHISSLAFKDGENIPHQYTKDGQNKSPALHWTGTPIKTTSLVLIVHDPDAHVPGGFTHWIIFNLPAGTKELLEAITWGDHLVNGATQCKNDGGVTGYLGPAPPPGNPHHYHFKLYAIDKILDLTPTAGRTEVLDAIRGHILDEAELTGLYQR